MELQPTKKRFESFYEKYCEINNRLYSIYNVNFQTAFDVDLIMKNPKYEVLYVFSDINLQNIEDKFVVVKNESNILLCFDVGPQHTDLKLVFDSNTVNKKDLELFIITLRKNKIS